MNFPRAKRLRLCLAISAIAAFAVVLPSVASADFAAAPTANAVFGSNVPGAHGDYTITHGYTYNGVPSGVPSTTGDDLKQWVVDSPAGLVGNPNAVPFAERCTQAQWATAATNPAACPVSSRVGDAVLTLRIDANGAIAAALNGNIYILQSAGLGQEVPTELGTIFPTSMTTATVSHSVISPVSSGTDGDFRLRTVSDAPINRPVVAAGPTYGNIAGITQHLLGMLPNGNAFLTNPSRCSNWDSYLYGQTYGDVGGAASQTNSLGGFTGTSGTYTKSTSPTTSPNCGTVPAFSVTASTTLSTNTRDSNPQLEAVISNPTAPGGDLPKSVTTTLPASITTDLQSPALLAGNLCEPAQADAGTCPAAGKVGVVKIDSPMLAAGLTGDVFAVRGSSTVPDLLVEVAGTSNAINFRMKGTSKFVGPRTNQIQTTFDNLPQVPFTKFTLTIAGGTNSLLTISKCPTDGSSPEDGPIDYTMNGYSTGNTAASSTATSFAGCYGKPTVKSIKKCITYNLKVTPRNLLNTANIAKVELYVGKKSKKVTKRISKDVKAPFKFNKRISSKFKKGQKFYFRVKSTYKPTIDAPAGKQIYSKVASAKRCK